MLFLWLFLAYWDCRVRVIFIMNIGIPVIFIGKGSFKGLFRPSYNPIG